MIFAVDGPRPYAQFDEPRLYESLAGHPSTAQRAAVAAAEVRACALRPDLLTPLWIWVHCPGVRVRAVTRFPVHGALVYLRDDLTPSQTYATSLHELQHVYDEKVIVRDLISDEEAERRAENFAGYALGEEPTMEFYEEQCRRVDALCATGLSRTAAWAQIGTRGPLRGSHAAPAAAAGAARNNGHVAGLPPVPRCPCGGYLIRTGIGLHRGCGWCGRSRWGD